MVRNDKHHQSRDRKSHRHEDDHKNSDQNLAPPRERILLRHRLLPTLHPPFFYLLFAPRATLTPQPDGRPAPTVAWAAAVRHS